MIVKTAAKFSLIVFAPVLIAFLIPASFLLPVGVLLTLIAIFDPTIPLSSAATYNLWIIGPALAALGLYFVGRGLYSLHLRRWSHRAIWLATWVIYSVLLFLAIWIGFAILVSVGASDKPIRIFLSLTALFAAGLTLLAQAFVVPWLIAVSRMFPGSTTIDSATLDD